MPTSISPFTGIHRQLTPSGDILRASLSAGTLAEASQILEDHSIEGLLPQLVVLKPAEVAAARDDRLQQSYLVPTLAQAESGVSSSTASCHTGPVNMSTDRFTRGVSTESGGTNLNLGAAPTSTSATTSNTTSAGDLSQTAVAGRDIKGVKFGIAPNEIAMASGVFLQSSDKIAILGPTMVRDGQTLHLARFASSLTPILDADLVAATGPVSLAARLVLSRGKSTTYDKFVPTHELAGMMRARDHWFRNLVEFGLATRLANSTKRPLSISALAANAAHIDGWLPGEGATWSSNKGVVLAFAGGVVAGRATISASLSGGVNWSVVREDETHVVLSVQPSTTAGVRLSVEAKLLADLGVDYGTAARQRRAWRFNTNYMSSRHALSLALSGRLPGLMLPGTPDTMSESYATYSLLARESLPFGVESIEWEFMRQTSLGAALTGIRLPEILGGSSLFVAKDISEQVLSSSSSDSTSLTRTVSSVSSVSLLSAGSFLDKSSAEISVSIGQTNRGAREVQHSGLRVVREMSTMDSHRFGRKRVSSSLGKLVSQQFSSSDIQPTQGYKASIAYEFSRVDLEKSAQIGDARLFELAKQNQVSQAVAVNIRQLVRNFTQTPAETANTGALRVLSRHGGAGMALLCAMSGVDNTPELSVQNLSHDALLKDFLKLEVYAHGARSAGHAKKALARCDKYIERLNNAMLEVQGDAILAHADDAAPARQNNLLRLMLAESKAIQSDLKSGLGLRSGAAHE